MTQDALPKRFEDEEALDAFMARPSPVLEADLAATPGRILVLGAGGKMGPTLARLARNASAPDRSVIAVARFSEAGLESKLRGWGVETIACDLMDRDALERLPDAENVVFMAGRKFGASGSPALTWAMNAYLPALVAERYRNSRIVAFSTGNVYPLVPTERGGATEDTLPGPVGEYAQSCLGRERMFEHFSAQHGTPGRLIRLNYAIDLRYGVLHDIARRIAAGTPVDVTMGHVNVLWQGDANTQALRCLRHCTTPTSPINLTGPEVLSVRWVAGELGRRMGRTPQILGDEAPAALLNDSAQATTLFGPPSVPVEAMLDWVADWVGRGMASLGKPTKFEVRDGVF